MFMYIFLDGFMFIYFLVYEFVYNTKNNKDDCAAYKRVNS